jgi:hypothetical protein
MSITNATGGLFDTELYVHHALDDLHEAGFSDTSMIVVGPEEEQVDMRHSDSDLDNMVEDGAKLRRWGQTPEQWHFQNGDPGIMLQTTYRNEGREGLRDALKAAGFSEEKAETFASGVADGLTLVIVHDIQAEHTDRARDILIKHGAATAT